MRAGFGDQDTVARPEPVDRFRTPDEGADVPFRAGQEHGEGSERNFLWDSGIHRFERLGVRDDQGGSGAESRPCGREAFRRAAVRDAAAVQQFAEHLHLRQDDASFGRLAVLGHHEQHGIARLHQAAGKEAPFLPGCRFRNPSEEGFQFPGLPGGISLRGTGTVSAAGPVDNDRRHFGRAQQVLPPIVRRVAGAQQHGKVGRVDDAARKSFTLCAQRSFITIPGGVDEGTCSEPRQLDPFADGVGRRSRKGADKGDLLSGQGVDQGGFSAVGGAEKSDLHQSSNSATIFLMSDGFSRP